MSRAAIAAGADGLMIEVHPDPKSALSDGPQSLDFEDFSELLEEVKKIAQVVGRRYNIMVIGDIGIIGLGLIEVHWQRL